MQLMSSETTKQLPNYFFILVPVIRIGFVSLLQMMPSMGKALVTNLQWLQDNTILTQLAYYPPYTLFQIQAHDAEK